MTRKHIHFAAAAACALTAACDSKPPAPLGDPNSIIVAMPDSLWAESSDTVLGSLEATLFTVRDEQTFKVTQVAPTSAAWTDLRKFRHVIVVGQRSDPWVQRALEDERAASLDPPTIVEDSSVWAGNQRVYTVVLPPENETAALVSVLPEIYGRIEADFRRFTLRRMFVSGIDSALTDTLRRRAGFSLWVPVVYDWTVTDSIYIFRNTNPSPGELFRSVLVTWRSGSADSLRAGAALAWRDSLADRFYDYHEQVTRRERLEIRRPEGEGQPVLEIHGVWSTAPGSWPAGGPFVTRLVACPEQDRTYLLDAWLYAPGKDKYQYMIQLEVILDTFVCGADPTGAAMRTAAGTS